MATYHNSITTLTSRSPALRIVQADIANFWGHLAKEKFYVISKLELLELISATPDDPPRAAIKIKNIRSRNKSLVTARWVAYPGDEIVDGSDTDDHYFVLDYDVASWFVLDTNAVAARIAKTLDGDFYVYFHRVRVNFKNEGGTGGDIMTAGVRVGRP